MKKFIYIDTETTGANPEKHGIWQLAGYVEIDNKIKEKFAYNLSPFPNDLIDIKALEIGGKSEQDIKSFENPNIVYKEFSDLLKNYVDKFNPKDKLFFVGYNAHFDMNFLRSWFVKNGDNYFGSFFWFPPIDVMQLAANSLINDRHLLPNFKLSTVCNHFGIQLKENENLHEAETDIRLTFDLYKKLSQ